MTDYIDREEIRSLLYRADAITMQGVRIINQFPAADVKLVVRGKWKLNTDSFYPYCSNCRCDALGRSLTDFCPYCGADMREDEEDKE